MRLLRIAGERHELPLHEAASPEEPFAVGIILLSRPTGVKAESTVPCGSAFGSRRPAARG